MQMVKKILLLTVLFWIALLAFMPKEEIYFALERKLVKEGVEINEQKITEGLFDLTIESPVIYVKGVKAATAQKVTFFTTFFMTKVIISDLRIDTQLRVMLFDGAKRVTLIHSVLDPLNIHIDAEGSFGLLSGIVSLKDHRVHIDFSDIKKIGTIKSNLKKGEKGWYYESDF
jgi:hypothetical protein